MARQGYFLKRMNRYIVVGLSLFFLANGAAAQSEEQKEGGLIGTLTGQKIGLDPKSGEEVLIPAEGVSPGDTIEYTLAYQNREATHPLKGIVIATPIPHETTWIISSAKTEVPSSMEASIDGGIKYQKPPIMIPTKGPDGEEIIMVEAPAEAYTHLRWILSKPLGPGEQALVRYRVKVK